MNENYQQNMLNVISISFTHMKFPLETQEKNRKIIKYIQLLRQFL